MPPAFEGVRDLIVKEVSDLTLAEVRRDAEEKKRGYALAGVQEYFILDPEDRCMRFHRQTTDRRYAERRPDAAGVIRSQVLPGFRFRRTDLLNLPDPAGLAPDETYAGYVIPGHRDAVNRAEEATAARRHAEERAEAEAASRRHAEEQIQALKAEIA